MDTVAFFKGYLFKSAEEIPGGKAEGKPTSKYDAKELAEGIKVEREHTPDTNVAKEIAKDHLEEFPDYYTRLKKMEEEAKAEGGETMASEEEEED